MTCFDNNEDKVYSLLKNNVGGSRVRSRARSRVRSPNYRLCDHNVTLK